MRAGSPAHRRAAIVPAPSGMPRAAPPRRDRNRRAGGSAWRAPHGIRIDTRHRLSPVRAGAPPGAWGPTDSERDEGLEATPEHALAVERHLLRVHVLVQP